jgi:hypothetical protein
MSRRNDPLFEYGDYWVAREPGRPGLYRYWIEGRRVRRRKLAAVELDGAFGAKAELIAFAERRPVAARSPEVVMIATVLAHYETNVILPKRRQPDRKTNVERGFLLTRDRLMAFLSEKQPDGSMRSAHGKAARVSELDLPTQRAFWRVLHKLGCSARSIAIYMSYIAAAVNDAAKPRVVDRDGREEETSILTHPVHIVAQDKVIAEVLKSPLSEPRDWVPTMNQMASLLDECAEHVFRYLVVALNTWARPEAVTDLNFETHVDVDHRLVNLLPAGRAQNDKRRPTIPLTDTLLGWALTWNEPYPIRWEGERVVSVKKALRRVGTELGMSLLNRYTIRHFMATRVRRQKLSRGRYVSREQRSLWLGHSIKEGSDTTSWYETYDPDYLSEAREATDIIMRELDRLMRKRRLLPPSMRGDTKLAVVAGGKG